MAMDRSNVIVFLLFPRGQDSPLPDDDRTPGVFHGIPFPCALNFLKGKDRFSLAICRAFLNSSGVRNLENSLTLKAWPMGRY